MDIFVCLPVLKISRTARYYDSHLQISFLKKGSKRGFKYFWIVTLTIHKKNSLKPSPLLKKNWIIYLTPKPSPSLPLKAFRKFSCLKVIKKVIFLNFLLNFIYLHILEVKFIERTVMIMLNSALMK